jgi:GT2 family glycosyltransferase
MRISVISPSFNQAQFLPDNLRTVSGQRGVELEHIIVDPGSTDGSTGLARAATHATLIAEPDRGQSHGITKGFERCTGDVMTWLNSDDFYPTPDTLKKVADAFAANPEADIVYGGVNFVDEQGKFLRKGFVNRDAPGLLTSFHQQVGIVQPGVFWRRRVFDELGGPSEEYNYCMDYELWVRMADAGFKWHYIDEVLAHHRWWDGMKTSSGRRASLIEHFRVGARYFGYIHWKWLDRYAEYCATKSDGVVNHAASVDAGRKADFARETITRFVTQDMLALLEHSDQPEHRETRDYIRRMAPNLKRVMFTETDITNPVYSHPDPKAEERVAWHIFDTEDPGSGKRYKSYRVPDNFTRHFDTDWYREQQAHAQQRLTELSTARKDTCVIVANGPSLNKSNLDLLENADVIVSNFATISDRLRPHATYFTVVNDLVAVQGSTDFNQLTIPRVVPFWLGNAINPGPDTIYLPATVVPEFCTTPDGLFSWRSTVSVYNMQLAYVLGYENVVLIGFDHSYVQAADLREGDAIEQKSEDPNHFDPRYFQGKTWQAADTGNMEKMYEVAFAAYRRAGRSIVNATEGGKLEVFPRMTLETALGAPDPTAARHALPPARPTEAEKAPRLLLFDMTAIGDGTATGEVKANLFGDWPAGRILQVARQSQGQTPGLALVRRDADGRWQTTPASAGEATAAIAAFAPETLLYRPVPNVPHLHGFAMETIARLENLPLVTWLMDDWPAETARSDPEQWAALEPDLEALLERAALNLSICEAMSEGFAGRYGRPFRAFANGIDPADWPRPDPQTGQKLLIRYAGGLAANMTRAAVLRIARAVEALAGAGHDIRLEISTQPWWYEQSRELFADFTHTAIETRTRPVEEYRAWLREADAVAIAYNFDPDTLRYVRYSMANKMPECLASGAVLFAHGPADIATIGYLADSGAARVVTEDSDAAVQDALLALLQDPAQRSQLAGLGHGLATQRHNITALRRDLRNAIAGAADAQDRADPASGESLLDQVIRGGQGASKTLLLTCVATELLLDPQITLRKLTARSDLRDAVDRALGALPDDNSAKAQYRRVAARAAVMQHVPLSAPSPIPAKPVRKVVSPGD